MKKIIFTVFVLLFLPIMASAVNREVEAAGGYIRDDSGSYMYTKQLQNGSGRYGTSTKGIIDKNGIRYYCIDPFSSFADSLRTSYEITNSDIRRDVLNRVKLIMYYGYGYGNRTSDQWIAFTNILLWRELYPSGEFYFTSTINGSKTSKYDNYLKEILNDVDKHLILPKLTLNNDLVVGMEVRVVDSNGVLDGYKVKTCTNCTARISGNNVFVTPTGYGKVNVVLAKLYDRFKDNEIFIWKDMKDMSNQHVVNTVNLDELRVEINGNAIYDKGIIEITKRDKNTDEPLVGVEYCLYSDSYELIGCRKTNQLGIISFIGINNGSYYYKEVGTLDWYILDDDYHFVKINGTKTKYSYVAYNEKMSEITINKIDVYGNQLDGYSIDIYQKVDDEYILYLEGLIDENGRINISLLTGSYYYVEVKAPDGYLISLEEYYFEVEANNLQYEFELINEVIPPEEEIIEKEPEEILEDLIPIDVPDTEVVEIPEIVVLVDVPDTLLNTVDNCFYLEIVAVFFRKKIIYVN